MAVTFSGLAAINTETLGINFEAYRDEDRIVCVVSTGALQDIQPSNASDTAEEQFLANRFAFQAIAEKLIKAGKDVEGFLYIGSQHVAA